MLYTSLAAIPNISSSASSAITWVTDVPGRGKNKTMGFIKRRGHMLWLFNLVVWLQMPAFGSKLITWTAFDQNVCLTPILGFWEDITCTKIFKHRHQYSHLYKYFIIHIFFERPFCFHITVISSVYQHLTSLELWQCTPP